MPENHAAPDMPAGAETKDAFSPPPAPDAGVMVGFWLPPDLAARLAVPGGEPADQLHLTLCYFGKVREIGTRGVDRLDAICREVARYCAPLTGTISGVGRFSASATSDGKDVVYASADVPALADFRHQLKCAAECIGVAPSRAHGFTPHVTLAYVDPAAESPVPRVEPATVAFDRLVLAVGGVRKEYPLGEGDCCPPMGCYPVGFKAMADGSIAGAEAVLAAERKAADAPPAGVEYKAFQAVVSQPDGGQPGEIEAIVSVFSNVDYGGDRIRPGFFAKSLRRKLPKGVWGHDWLIPVAKTLEARELMPGDPLLPPDLADLGGLYIRGLFNLETQRGREAHSDIKFGIIDEFSIGYAVAVAEDKDGVRELIEGDCFEWSPVLVGMNNATRLLSIKGLAAAEMKAGRVLSAANRSRLATVRDAMRGAADDIDDLLMVTDPEQETAGKAADMTAPPESTEPPATKAAGADAVAADAVAADAPAPSLADRSERLVADATELTGLYRKAADQRRADGRTLSPPKRDAIKAAGEALLALHAATEPPPDPSVAEAERTRKLRLLRLRHEHDAIGA